MLKTRPLTAPLSVLLVLLVLLVSATTVLAVAGPAAATWSIVAVDEDTGEVGAALASCVPAGVLGEPDRPLVPVVLVPGVGAAITQGSILPTAPGEMRQLLTDGAGPQQLIDAVLEEDDQASARQYAVVLLAETEGARVATHTGVDVEPARGDRTGPSMAVSGVLLADDGALTATLEAFDAAERDGRSLADALVAALQVGAERGGDRRCGPDQTALFAHVAVAGPDDDPSDPSELLTVTVDEGDGQNPVTLLAEARERGDRGWVDVGLADPAGVPRTVVFAIGVVLAIAAFLTIRKGLGTPAARR